MKSEPRLAWLADARVEVLHDFEMPRAAELGGEHPPRVLSAKRSRSAARSDGKRTPTVCGGTASRRCRQGVLRHARRLSEFETNLRQERQAEGIAAAKQRGAYRGRPPRIDMQAIKHRLSMGLSTKPSESCSYGIIAMRVSHEKIELDTAVRRPDLSHVTLRFGGEAILEVEVSRDGPGAEIAAARPDVTRWVGATRLSFSTSHRNGFASGRSCAAKISTNSCATPMSVLSTPCWLTMSWSHGAAGPISAPASRGVSQSRWRLAGRTPRLAPGKTVSGSSVADFRTFRSRFRG